MLKLNLLVLISISSNKLLVSECANIQQIKPLIFGGKELNNDEITYLVRLDGTLQCENASPEECYEETYSGSGSIISQRWILTAAHCTANSKSIDIYQFKDNRDNKIGEMLEHFEYPNYDSESDIVTIYSLTTDIALVKTVESFVLAKDLQPIALTNSPFRSDMLGVIAGYGQSEEGVDKPRQGVILAINNPYYDDDDLIFSNGVTGIGPGDSGGPLVSIVQGYLFGVSVGAYMSIYGDKVDIYVDVYTKLDWINKTIDEN